MDIAKVIIHSERVNFQNFFLFLVNDEFSGFSISFFQIFFRNFFQTNLKSFFTSQKKDIHFEESMNTRFRPQTLPITIYSSEIQKNL
jgi:hypothetical protein